MRVLVATDGSAPATIGVQLASGIRWPAGTVVRVMTALDPRLTAAGGSWPPRALMEPTAMDTELGAAVTRSVEAAAEQLRQAGLEAEASLVDGQPSAAIVEEADRFGADLIILGSRGHGAIQEMVVGSVSASVLDAATVPVLIARAPRADRVLLAWDGSPASEHAASIVETWAIFRGTTVHAVTVTESNLGGWAGTAEAASPEVIDLYLQSLDDARAERRALAQSLADRLAAAGLTADAEMREGGAAEEILAAATAWGADLIVMGTHGRTGFARLALGSVARNVVHHAGVSVLVAPDRSSNGTVDREVGPSA